MQLKFLLIHIVSLSFFFVSTCMCSLNLVETSTEVLAEGSCIQPALQKKIQKHLISHPHTLFTDIDYILEEKINANQSLESALIKKLANDKTTDAKDFLRRRMGRIHNDFAQANAMYNFLKANPQFISYTLSSPDYAKDDLELNASWNQGRAFEKVAKVTKLSLTFDQYQLLKSHLKNIPYFKLITTLQECNDCEISRTKNPIVRKHFEDQVMRYIKLRHPDTSKPLIITDFGSGDLFQIFVILNKLQEAGYTYVRLCIIDSDYHSLCERYRVRFNQTVYFAAQELGQNKTMATILMSQLPGRVELNSNLLEYTHDDYKFFTEFSQFIHPLHEDRETKVSNARIQNAFAYFLQWFNATSLKLKLFVFSSAEMYTISCTRNTAMKSDVLLGIDFPINSNKEFESLRKNTLKPTGYAFSIERSCTGGDAHLDLDESEIHDACERTFHFCCGSQKQPSSARLEWDLKAKKLKAPQQ